MSDDGFFARARRHGGFALGAILVAALISAAALSLVWTPYSPRDLDVPHKLALPSMTHWLGTDALGRDVASQILAGARVSLLVGVIAVGIGLAFGVALGLFAASAKGLVEDAIMKLCDFTFAFPALLMAILLTATYGPGVSSLGAEAMGANVANPIPKTTVLASRTTIG